MLVSACLWGLREPPAEAAVQLDRLGVDGVDVEPGFILSRGQVSAAAPITVNCLAADHLMPAAGGLGNRAPDASRIAVEHIGAGIREAAELGAEAVYVGPSADSDASLRNFEKSVVKLAGEAAAVGLRFCIEHVPGSMVGSASEAVDFSNRIGHPNLHALIDIGHCLLVGENPAEAIRAAEHRLGYVHLDDNDGKNDQHLALTNGLFDADDVREILTALRESPYEGPVSIEVRNDLEDPLAAVEMTLDVLRRAEGEI